MNGRVQSDPRLEAVREMVGTPAATANLLTVIVPVYNEERMVERALTRVLAACYPKQVVVVDDGSTDGTRTILDRLNSAPGPSQQPDHACADLVLVRHSANRGKGAAIRTGLEHAIGRFTIIQDADLEYDPEDYPRVIEPLLCGEAQVVYGSRYLDRETASGGRWDSFRLGVCVLNWCVRLLCGQRLTDEATCYKAFPTETLRIMDLRCERFEFCPEVTAKACRLGLKILEVPIRYKHRTVQEGKKIRWRDGVEALLTLWRWHSWTPPRAADLPGACAAGAQAADGRTVRAGRAEVKVRSERRPLPR